MVDWKTIKKIDAHIHILPDDVHEANPDPEDAWVHAADLHKFCGLMTHWALKQLSLCPLMTHVEEELETSIQHSLERAKAEDLIE